MEFVITFLIGDRLIIEFLIMFQLMSGVNLMNQRQQSFSNVSLKYPPVLLKIITVSSTTTGILGIWIGVNVQQGHRLFLKCLIQWVDSKNQMNNNVSKSKACSFYTGISWRFRRYIKSLLMTTTMRYVSVSLWPYVEHREWSIKQSWNVRIPS